MEWSREQPNGWRNDRFIDVEKKGDFRTRSVVYLIEKFCQMRKYSVGNALPLYNVQKESLRKTYAAGATRLAKQSRERGIHGFGLATT